MLSETTRICSEIISDFWEGEERIKLWNPNTTLAGQVRQMTPKKELPREERRWCVSGRREEGVVVVVGGERSGVCVWVEGGVECVWVVWGGVEWREGEKRPRLWGFVWRTRRGRRNVDLNLNSFYKPSQKWTSQQEYEMEKKKNWRKTRSKV